MEVLGHVTISPLGGAVAHLSALIPFCALQVLVGPGMWFLF